MQPKYWKLLGAAICAILLILLISASISSPKIRNAEDDLWRAGTHSEQDSVRGTKSVPKAQNISEVVTSSSFNTETNNGDRRLNSKNIKRSQMAPGNITNTNKVSSEENAGAKRIESLLDQPGPWERQSSPITTNITTFDLFRPYWAFPLLGCIFFSVIFFLNIKSIRNTESLFFLYSLWVTVFYILLLMKPVVKINKNKRSLK